MKTIVISDIHGNGLWKDIVEKENFDKVVFLADYFDSHDNISAAVQIHNFNEIIYFKEQYPDKVILLFGNHDFHYRRGAKNHYSGYNEIHAFDIQEVLHNAMDKEYLQMCHIDGYNLFVHAGITRTWLSNQVGYDQLHKDGKILEEFVNDLFKYKSDVFEFTSGDHFNPYGDEICQTPIWIRPGSLRKDRIDGFIQIVGHTIQDKLILTPEKGIILCDTLNSSGEYLIIEDGKFSVGQTK